MSSDLFPTLPGITYPIHRGQQWSTTVQEAASGKETTISWWSYPRWKWDIPIEFLRQSGAFQELSALSSFYAQHYGRGDTWLYTEPADCAVTGQLIGTGNGSTKTFQLVRALGGVGGFVEPIWAPLAVSAVTLNGVSQGSGWSVSSWGATSPGVITFTSAPANGVAVRASFSYAFPCRFQEDEYDFDQIGSGLYACDSLKFYSVK